GESEWRRSRGTAVVQRVRDAVRSARPHGCGIDEAVGVVLVVQIVLIEQARTESAQHDLRGRRAAVVAPVLLVIRKCERFDRQKDSPVAPSGAPASAAGRKNGTIRILLRVRGCLLGVGLADAVVAGEG